MMLQSSSLCFLFCLPFLFLITTPLGTSSTLRAMPTDIIDQTCKRCANQSISLSYSLCSTSLQVIPVSHAANLQGLALIAMELALENATDTLSTIEELLKSTSFDNLALACLEDCLELYYDAAWTILNSLGAFLSESYEIASTWMGAVKEAATACQEGFEEKGEVSPLAKENYNLLQLCDIALCIIHMFTLAIPF